MPEPFEESPLPEAERDLYGTEMCWHYALAFQRETDYKSHIVALRDKNGKAVHFAARRDEDTLIDARGVWSEADLLAEWQGAYTERITPSNLLDEIYDDANDPNPPAPRFPGYPTVLGEYDIEDVQRLIRAYDCTEMMTAKASLQPR